jgi:hypothetical protein
MRIGIRPGVNILGVLRHLEYKPWYALAEYVDNSIQSFMAMRSALGADAALRVSIEVDRQEQRISIRDNAAGIAEADIPRAFRPAEPPSVRNGLSEFGMGMKSASCWFSPFWEVRTSALGEPVERRIRFDIERILEDRLEELEIETLAADIDSHYTEIILRNVYHVPQGRTLGKIREHLTDIYRCFLRDGTIDLSVIGSGPVGSSPTLSYIEPESLNSPRYSTDNEPNGPVLVWRKSLAFELADGRVVCGHAGILAEGDTRNAGLCLFRRARAIVGTGDEKYRPAEIFGSSNSYETQRIWGELHMDDFEVSHTKDGFRWGDSEEDFLIELRKALDEEPMPLLRQARNYRTGRPTRRASERTMDTAVANVVTALVTHLAEDIERVSTAPEIADPPAELPTTDNTPLEDRTFTVHAVGGVWHITVQLTSDEGATEWLEVASDASEAHRTRRVGLRVNSCAPFMRRIVCLHEQGSLEPVLRIAAAVGLSEILARASGNACGPGELRRNINELLASSLSHRVEGST